MPKAENKRAKKKEPASGLTADDRQWLGNQFKHIDLRFEKIDGQFEKTDSRFEKIDRRFEKIESQLDRIVNKLVDHEGRLASIETNMVTKGEFRIESDRVNNMLDRQTRILEKLDHEQAAMRSAIMRHEELLNP